MLAVYGTLRKGNSNHRLIDGELKWEGRINGFVMHNLGGFPTCVEGNSSIYVEVYDVTGESARQIEYLEGYPDFFDRLTVDTPAGKAQMYSCPLDKCGNADIINTGDWNDARRNW